MSPSLPRSSASLQVLASHLPYQNISVCQQRKANNSFKAGGWIFFSHRPSSLLCAVRYIQTRHPGLSLTPWEAQGLLTSLLFTENICRNTYFLIFACKLQQAPWGSGRGTEHFCRGNMFLCWGKLAPRSIIPLQECKSECSVLESNAEPGKELTVCSEWWD